MNRDDVFLTVFGVILARNMDSARPTSDLVFSAQEITDEVMAALNKMSKSSQSIPKPQVLGNKPCLNCGGRGRATYTHNTYWASEEECHMCGGTGFVKEKAQRGEHSGVAPRSTDG